MKLFNWKELIIINVYWLMIIILCVVANHAKGQTLQDIPIMTWKPILTWPPNWQKIREKDPDLIEYCRITRHIGISLHYTDATELDAVKDIADAVAQPGQPPLQVTIHVSPDHQAGGSEAFDEPSHLEDKRWIGNLEWLIDKSRTVAELCNERELIVRYAWMDREAWSYAREIGKGNDPAYARARHEACYLILQRFFPQAEVGQFCQGRVITTKPWDPPEEYDATPAEWLGFAVNQAHYNLPDHHDLAWALPYLVEKKEATKKPLWVWLALGCRKQTVSEWPFGNWISAQHVIDGLATIESIKADYPVGDSWRSGYYVWRTKEIEGVIWWPGAMDMRVPRWKEHFIAWCAGALGKPCPKEDLQP